MHLYNSVLMHSKYWLKLLYALKTKYGDFRSVGARLQILKCMTMIPSKNNHDVEIARRNRGKNKENLQSSLICANGPQGF